MPLAAKTETKKSDPVLQATMQPSPVVPMSQAPAASQPRSDKTTHALNIIAEESGLAVEDLTDDCAFADIGVDSLLSMVIASRFREELGLDLDSDFSIFLDFPSVKHLRDFLDPPGVSASAEAQRVPPTGHVEAAVTSHVEAAFISHVEAAVTSHVEAAVTSVADDTVQITQAPANVETAASPGAFGPALEIIAEESGLSLEDLTDDTAFADLGVDSLLSMVIASRFREELDLDLESEFSIFLDFPTIKHLRDFFTGGGSQSQEADMIQEESEASPTPSSSELSTIDIKASDTDVISLSDSSSEPDQSTFCRPATSIILQGFPKTSQKTLFLLPDGAGSASSYIPIPRLGADVAVVGLNCPYAREPEKLKCTIEDLMDSYVAEIRRRQPVGPYHLGGWSSGGIFAFIAAQRLIKQGQEVLSLIIIDSPVPNTMDRLPTDFYEYCEKIRLFGDAPAPEWLIPHFKATVEVLEGYQATPITKQSKLLKASIIWATHSLLDGQDVPPYKVKPGDPKGVNFLLERRKDFGPCGWQDLLPDAEFLIEKVVGANHFTLMVSSVSSSPPLFAPLPSASLSLLIYWFYISNYAFTLSQDAQS
jgi:noranthrone synthase